MRRFGLPAALGTALLLACTHAAPPPPAPPPAPDSAWATTLADVKQLVSRGEYAAADSLLLTFSATHLGTPQSSEALFWRALVQLDPANPHASPRDALLAIDGYLAGGAALPHFQEALVLRRTASLLERVRTPVVTATVTPLPVPDDTLRSRILTDSIKALREELTRTQAELERIRRRIRP
ncbi:MAG TPA: hypothetical protein VFS08_21115 [Gemmatimonadaceae bacterium]|nr:hypothetical protein [Gemmatimonadaceae bacterium]